MFDWICALTADCLTCQNIKPKPKHRNEDPLEEWKNGTVPFRSVQIDQKGPPHPTSANNVHCVLIIDAFSQFLKVYPVRNTTTLATIRAVKKWILFLKSRNQSTMIEVLLLSIQCSSTVPKNLELLEDLVQLIHPGQMVKLEPRTNILLDIGKTFLMMPEQTGLHYYRSLHSPKTQVSTTQLEKPHLKVSLGPNHKFLCCSSYDFIGKNTNIAILTSVQTSPSFSQREQLKQTNCWLTYFHCNFHMLS